MTRSETEAARYPTARVRERERPPLFHFLRTLPEFLPIPRPSQDGHRLREGRYPSWHLAHGLGRDEYF